MEKEMATHSSILAWEIPWTEEPGGLESMGLERIKCDLATKTKQQRLGVMGENCRVMVTGYAVSFRDHGKISHWLW